MISKPEYRQVSCVSAFIDYFFVYVWNFMFYISHILLFILLFTNYEIIHSTEKSGPMLQIPLYFVCLIGLALFFKISCFYEDANLCVYSVNLNATSHGYHLP